MDNKEKMLKYIENKGKITSSDLAMSFGFSRQYINQVLKYLISDKKIVKVGSTKSTAYFSLSYIKENPSVIPNIFRKRYKNKGLEEHRVLIEIQDKFPILMGLPENIQSIFTFTFSEMFNNAIEHSKSKSIQVEVSVIDKKLSFMIEDSGIGVFRNIKNTRKLKSEIEAIQDLLKGKTTTMPKSHSGEGIFFTSRSAEMFILDSFGYQLIVKKTLPSIKDIATIKRGTRIIFEISTSSNLHLNDVFKKYTNLTEDSDYGFDKTEIRVKLYTMGGVHISRSQARRIISGLEKFQIILLDFDGVPVVGQAFADEIYRVFQNTFPNIEIKEENMSEGVRFMIDRAKNEAKRR